MQGKPILVLYDHDGRSELKMEYLADDFSRESLNGESIYHIYYVRLVTELFLRELSVSKPELSLSKEEIEAISMASAIHDIGKLRIPKSILDFPGKLSPVEYDIVKKHTVFGEQMIREADHSEIDPKVIEYAALIARCHHERVDGTGYPDGLRGDAVPLCAQVVALADSYDALTSPRSYKEPYSQDVALQMISSGMCGVFDKELLDCLMRVVNHRTLVSFRENIMKKRTVVEEGTDLRLKRVLLIGNTKYLTNEFVRETFPQSKVTVVGNASLDDSMKVKAFRVREPSVKSILETYEFDLIVFFAAGLSFHTADQSDAEQLREVLQYASNLQPKAKFLYFSSLDASFKEHTDRAILAAAHENLCAFYAKQQTLDIKVVQIPYFYSGTCQTDFLYGVFEQVYQKTPVSLPSSPESILHFISLSDLSELITRIVGGWRKGSGILSVGDEFHITYAEFADSLIDLAAWAKAEYAQGKPSGILKTNNTALRNEYGWFAKVSILDELESEYIRYRTIKETKSETLLSRLKTYLSKHPFAVKVVELILLFLLSELFIHLTDSAVIFSIVDFRTIYIVIMATLYGLWFGMAASTLTSISYFVAKVMAGADPLTLFYEPTNWLPFVFFFLVGGLCGYVNLKKEDRANYLEEQNRLLEDKLTFIDELYEDTLQEKKALKKQIISSKDSFGKIFDITRKLNTVAPQQLYLKTVETFEEILENKSITVYSVNQKVAFGRLEVASRELLSVAARSISMEAYAPVIEQLKDGNIWKNTELKRDFPMYAAGVYRGSELVLMLFLWHADLDQRSLYYVNLLKILRDLVQMSLLRAYDYNNELLAKQYVEGTRIMRADFFEQYAADFAALAEKKVSSYLQLEFDLNGHTLSEANEMLAGKVRLNDILGVTRDGKLRLILSQATEKDLGFILPRFENLDITTTIVR